MATEKLTHISLTDAKHKLGELAKRSAYGGERFVLESHGRPQAAIVGIEDLRLITQARMTVEERLARLEEATKIRKQIEARTGIQRDSAELIREAREERDEQLAGNG